MIPEVDEIDFPSLPVQDLHAKIKNRLPRSRVAMRVRLPHFMTLPSAACTAWQSPLSVLSEEVAADVYFQVWREAARSDCERAAPLTWLLTICRSRALDALRRRDRVEPGWPHDLADEESGPLINVGNRAQIAVIRGAGGTRATATTVGGAGFLRGLTHQEIADHSGLALGTVKMHIRNALIILQREIQANIMTQPVDSQHTNDNREELTPLVQMKLLSAFDGARRGGAGPPSSGG